MNNQNPSTSFRIKGLAPIVIILIVVGVLVIGGGVYYYKIQKEAPEKKIPAGCKDSCGDGTCQEAVCLATNCPCAENKQSCPIDCTEK